MTATQGGSPHPRGDPVTPETQATHAPRLARVLLFEEINGIGHATETTLIVASAVVGSQRRKAAA